MFGQPQVYSQGVDDLLDEPEVIAEFESFYAMRLKVVLSPDPLHHSRSHLQVRGQRADAPVGRVGRRFPKSRLHDASCLGSFTGRLATTTGSFPGDALEPIRCKAVPPPAHRTTIQSQFAWQSLFCYDQRPP